MRTGICSFITCVNTPTGSCPHHGHDVLVEDLATPNIPQIYGIPISIEYIPSLSFAMLIFLITFLAIPYDAYVTCVQLCQYLVSA